MSSAGSRITGAPRISRAFWPSAAQPDSPALNCRVPWILGHPSRASENGCRPAPELMYVIHHGNFGINFDSTRDDSITCVFQSEDRTLSVNDLQPSVDNFGGLALKLAPGPREGLREFGFRLPPGLSAGWHDVRLRVR